MFTMSEHFFAIYTIKKYTNPDSDYRMCILSHRTLQKWSELMPNKIKSHHPHLHRQIVMLHGEAYSVMYSTYYTINAIGILLIIVTINRTNDIVVRPTTYVINCSNQLISIETSHTHKTEVALFTIATYTRCFGLNTYEMVPIAKSIVCMQFDLSQFECVWMCLIV